MPSSLPSFTNNNNTLTIAESLKNNTLLYEFRNLRPPDFLCWPETWFHNPTPSHAPTLDTWKDFTLPPTIVSYPARWSFSFILGPLHQSFALIIFPTSREHRNCSLFFLFSPLPHQSPQTHRPNRPCCSHWGVNCDIIGYVWKSGVNDLKVVRPVMFLSKGFILARVSTGLLRRRQQLSMRRTCTFHITAIVFRLNLDFCIHWDWLTTPTGCPKKLLTECCWSHAALAQSSIACYRLSQLDLEEPSLEIVFIGPRSDHSLPMSVTDWLTDWLREAILSKKCSFF